ncbi:MarR family transcriptional regulator [bacterium]|nr:MarR family transcriptional regulator [bacterium]
MGSSMYIADEMGLPNGISNEDHEALLNILATAELIKKESGRLFEPLGITAAQFNVLILLLAQSEDGEMNQCELSRMLMVNRANVTGLVDRLEAQELVRRIADNGDRRANRVRLTDAGRAVAVEAQDLYLSRIHTIMNVLSRDQWRELSINLSRIRAQVAST